MKRIFAIIVTLALTLSTVTPISANNTAVSATCSTDDHCLELNVQNLESLTDNELKEFIVAMGLSEAEADELIEAKKLFSFSSEKAIVRAGRFPSNPKIGDIFVDSIDISLKDLEKASTVLDVVGILAGYDISANVAIAIASSVITLIRNGAPSGAKGVRVTIEYYYGPDNDGEVRWNYRRVWSNYYY